MNKLATYIGFSKVDDEQRVVEGIMTSEALDSQEEIIAYEASKRAINKKGGYAEWRNLREMHQPKAAGTVPVIEFNDDAKFVKVAAKVVDDDAWAKVKAGVYKGFSVGGKSNASEKVSVGGKLITKHTDVDYLELSLVDRPSNPDASISLWKSDAYDALWDTHDVNEAIERVAGMLANHIEGKGDDGVKAKLSQALQVLREVANAKVEALVTEAGDTEPTAGVAKTEEPAPEPAPAPVQKQETPAFSAITAVDIAAAVIANPDFITAISKSLDTRFAKTEDLAKADTSAQVAARLGALEQQMDRMQLMKAVAGPVLREVPGAESAAAGAAGVKALQEVLKKATDPSLVQAVQREIAALQLADVYAGGGNRIG